MKENMVKITAGAIPRDSIRRFLDSVRQRQPNITWRETADRWESVFIVKGPVPILRAVAFEVRKVYPES